MVAVVTGATGEIGRQIAIQMANKGFTTVVTCRDAARGTALAEELAKETGGDVRSEVVDLASMASMREFGERVRGTFPEVKVLINNAAVVPATRTETRDGIESQFGVNVLGYYAMMQELLEPLKKAAPSRIVNVASNYAGGLDFDDLQFNRGRAYDETAAYQQSKQADRMLSWAAARRYKEFGITVNACHPGVVTSSLLKGLGMSSGWDSPADAASTPVFMATDSSLADTTGTYFQDSKPKGCKWNKKGQLGQDNLWRTLEAMYGDADKK